MRRTESVKTFFLFRLFSYFVYFPISILIFLFDFNETLRFPRGVYQKLVYFVQRFYFNKTTCFPLCAPIHLQCLKLSFSIRDFALSLDP